MGFKLESMFSDDYSFGDRLKNIMLFRGIDYTARGSIMKIVKGMYECGYLEYEKEYKDHRKERENICIVIKRHLDNIAPPDSKYICLYCLYFKCSADYLLGIIQEPDQALTDIKKEIGLSSESVEVLRRINKSKNASPDIAFLNELDTLDFILKNMYERLLRSDAALQAEPGCENDQSIGFTKSVFYRIGLFLNAHILKKAPAHMRYEYKSHGEYYGETLKKESIINGHKITGYDLIYGNNKSVNNSDTLYVIDDSTKIGQSYNLPWSDLMETYTRDQIMKELDKLRTEYEK